MYYEYIEINKYKLYLPLDYTYFLQNYRCNNFLRLIFNISLPIYV